jgi:hypothetical protein
MKLSIHKSDRRQRTWSGLGALLAAVSLLSVIGNPAPAVAAEGPIWKLTSTSEPTNLLTPQDEIVQMTVAGTGGTVYLYIGAGFVEVPYNVTAAGLQSALAAALGAGNTEVSGGPGDAGGTSPYLITFTGEFAGQEMPVEFESEGPVNVSLKTVRKGVDGGTVILTATNIGGSTDGSSVTISDSLSPELTAGKIVGYERLGEPSSTSGRPLACSASAPIFSCTYTGVVPTGDSLTVRVSVTIPQGTPASVPNEGSVEGGGAEVGASASSLLTVSATRASSFGVAPGSVVMGLSSRVAGAHPDVTTAFGIATGSAEQTVGSVKDVRADLPPGLVGNTVGMPRCTVARAQVADCPRDSIVGVATVVIRAILQEGFHSPQVFRYPVYNIAPSPGEPAAFIFFVTVFPVRLDTSVLSDGDYAVRVEASELSEADPVLESSVTIWGVPADHEGPGPIALNTEAHPELKGGLGSPAAGVSRVPLLTNPTQCTTPLTGHVELDEWGNRGVFSGESASLGTMTGCAALAFSGSMSMLPDTLEAGAPAGYDFNLHVPQVNDPNGLAQPDVRRVVTALAMGTVISPSAAVGLNSCSDEQFFGPSPERGLEEPAEPGDCPRDSQVGTISIRAPALELPLTGDVYLANPDCEPCGPQDAQDGKMIRLFVQVVGEGKSGIIVKLEGHASLNQQTGQLTATFDNNPQLPFSDLKLTLAGGSRATLANSRVCGAVSTSLDMMPWSNPFTTDVSAISTFEINQGCIAPRFDPSFVAGTTNIQAGEYSPFTLSFGRSDADEFLNGLQMQMPEGLTGSLTGVPLCKEPEASAGTCGAGSLIGHTQVLTGPGRTPFLVTGGQVFLTEGYKGAPFGLSIVVPAKAGPFTLTGTTGTGNVVVRAAINIDPHTTALTVTSDPLPTALDGIPLQLKVVNVTIDRPGFTINPTSCAKTAITGILSSKESGGAHVSSPFQVTNCARLGFKPSFKVSTSGKTSRKNGASLDAKLSYPRGAKYANIAKVKVDLPKQLPSRLTTLQKACPAATFNANPALCPKNSIVGIAKATTPILPVQLAGPAYFVSHGGEAFPNLIVVLQGYGVRVDLVGDTFINKAGVTSSTFNQVPDVPVSSFELYLPQGPDSALAANGNLCKSALKMPTTFVAQNGASIHQTTAIAVTGCNAASKVDKARKASRAARQRHKHGGKARGAVRPDTANRRGK